MLQSRSIIANAFVEFFFLAFLSLAAPLIVAVDVIIIGHEVPEASVTEFTQEGLLFLSGLLFALIAWRHEDQRGFYTLAAGFFGCMLVREMDSWFDMISHGFWLWPALFVAAASITSTMLFWRDTVVQPLAAFIDTKPYFFVIFGLIIVLVFSRTFGSGELLWRHVGEYNSGWKTMIQEGLELFGYIYIAYGSSLLFRHKNT